LDEPEPLDPDPAEESEPPDEEPELDEESDDEPDEPPEDGFSAEAFFLYSSDR